MKLMRNAFHECILPVMTYDVRLGRLATPNLRNWSQPKGNGKVMVGVTLKDRKSTN